MTFMFKHVYDQDIWHLMPTLIKMLKALEPQNTGFVETLLIYWLKRANNKKGPKAFINEIQKSLSLPKEGEFMTMAEQLIQQGMQQGMQEGQSGMLLQLLAFKFKNIPEEYRTQIEKASHSTLIEWGKKVLVSEQLEDIFDYQ